MTHFLDTSSIHQPTSFAMPGMMGAGMMGSSMMRPGGMMGTGMMGGGMMGGGMMGSSMGYGGMGMMGMPSPSVMNNALNHVPGAAKPLQINPSRLDLDDTGVAANNQAFGGMAVAVAVGLIVGCFLFRRGGNDDDDDSDEDEDSEEKSSN